MPEARDPNRTPDRNARHRDATLVGRRARSVARHRSRGRRLALSTVLALGLVGVVGGVATADDGVPFAGAHRVTSPELMTRTTAQGGEAVTQVRCRFWFWCRPVTKTRQDPAAPATTEPTTAPFDMPTSGDQVEPTATTTGPRTTAPSQESLTTHSMTTAPQLPAPNVTTAPPTLTTQPAPTPTAGDARAQKILDQLNAARAEAGVAPLTMSDGLVRAAAKHTQLMAGGCGMQHQCPGEADLGQRITAESVSWNSVGENIGYGGPVDRTDAAVVGMGKRLTESMLAETPPNDGHRRNILNAGFRQVGIVLYQDAKGTVWMTQDFSG